MAQATALVVVPFVGREIEMGGLRAALDLADSGRGRLLLITGEPGIGKSRLMDEFSSAASKHDWRILLGRCWEGGGAPAYWPWMQVVQQAGGQFEQLAHRQREDSPTLPTSRVEIKPFLPTIRKPFGSGSSNPWLDFSPASPDINRCSLCWTTSTPPTSPHSFC